MEMNTCQSLFLLYWWRRRKCYARNQKKRIWVRTLFQENTRARFGDGHNLIAEMRLGDQLKYKNFFRMGPEAFDELLNLVSPLIKKVDVRRTPISPATRLGITLRFLASGDTMTSLSYLFIRVGVSTISEIISETTAAIWQVIPPIYVPSLSEDTWKKNANGFRKTWNFPNCMGALDGKHVNIQAPPHSGSEFYNYKGSHSIVILAVVDDKYTFSVVDIGAQGRQSDGGILRNSTFGKQLYEKKLNIPLPSKISVDGLYLPYVIVGDEAFPLLENLLKPYSGRSGLNLDKNVFNYRLSRARHISENAFGILVARWRIFGQNIIGKLENIDKIVKATICIHNFIMRRHLNNVYFPPGLVDSEVNGPGSWRNYTNQLQPLTRVGSNTYTRNAREIRDEFCRFFNEEGAVPWQWDRL